MMHHDHRRSASKRSPNIPQEGSKVLCIDLIISLSNRGTLATDRNRDSEDSVPDKTRSGLNFSPFLEKPRQTEGELGARPPWGDGSSQRRRPLQTPGLA